MADAFIRKGTIAYRHTDPLGRTSRDNRGRVWSDAMKKLGDKGHRHPLEKRRNGFSLGPSERISPNDTLTSVQ